MIIITRNSKGKRASGNATPKTISSDYEISVDELRERSFFWIDNSANAVAITLPNVVLAKNLSIVFKSLSDPAVFASTVIGGIDGSDPYTFTNINESVEITSDGNTFKAIY